MAVFFKLKDKTFKSSSRIIVGRGAPFEILNDDRSVTRAHILLLYKKGKVYVKSLSDKGPSYLNGEQLKTGKLVEVKATDKIKIGEQIVEILGSAKPGTYTEIKRYATIQRHALFKYFVWLPLYGVMAYLVMSDGYSDDKATILFALGAVIFGIVFVIDKFIGPKLVSLKELYLSDEGFTVHFEDDTNMTFKLKEIDYWWGDENSQRLDIESNDQRYHMKDIDQINVIITFLSKKLPQRKQALVTPFPKNYVITTLAFTVTSFLTTGLIPVILMGLIALGSAALAANGELRSRWFAPDTAKFSESIQRIILIAVTLFAGYKTHEFFEIKRNDDYVLECSRGVQFACKKADFSQVKAGDAIVEKAARNACELGVNDACKISK